MLLGSKDKPRQYVMKQRHHFDDRDPYNHSYGFSSSHVWMWELDRKEGWEQNNWCFWIVVLEKTLECSLDSKEIKSGNPKQINNPECSLEGLMLTLKIRYLGHLMWRSDSGKDHDAGERLLLWAMNDTRILVLQRRGIWSGATYKPWSLRAFV